MTVVGAFVIGFSDSTPPRAVIDGVVLDAKLTAELAMVLERISGDIKVTDDNDRALLRKLAKVLP